MLDKDKLLENYRDNILEPIEDMLKRIRYLYYVKHNFELKPLLDRAETDFIYYLKKYEELF